MRIWEALPFKRITSWDELMELTGLMGDDKI